jgi:hypothetical protein
MVGDDCCTSGEKDAPTVGAGLGGLYGLSFSCHVGGVVAGCRWCVFGGGYSGELAEGGGGNVFVDHA